MDIKESHTRINENGRLVIPASFRKALGIASGDTVVLRLDDDELKITTLPPAYKAVTGNRAKTRAADSVPGRRVDCGTPGGAKRE